ncbi:MAG: glycosyltransferase family 2 protein [Patescibacteria group bacterium]
MTNPKVTAIIVTWNGKELIGDCLAGLLASESVPTILVIDNASADGTADFVRQNYPQVEVVETGENLGYGRGCNVGIRRAMQAGADYILLVNQDAKLQPEALGRLVQAGENHPDMGILIPLNLTSDGQQVDSDFADCLSDRRLRSYFSDLVSGTLKDAYLAGLLPGAVKLVRRQTVERIGVFDPIFFMYGVEFDYHLRAEHHGWQSGLVPEAIIFHSYEGHRTQGQPPPTYRQRVNKLTWISYLGLKRLDRSFSKNCIIVYGRFVIELARALARGDHSQIAACFAAGAKTTAAIPRIVRHRRISFVGKDAFVF